VTGSGFSGPQVPGFSERTREPENPGTRF
jgi:hypothetical protein